MKDQMSVSARHVLNVAILRHPELNLPIEGWEHYATGLTDNGGFFAYDREDGRSLYVITGGEQGHDIDFGRSILNV